MQTRYPLCAAMVAALCLAGPAVAQVSADQVAKLKTSLTPFGAEKAGNKDGTIPAWTGGHTTPIAGDVPGGRRGDPFKDEKPLFSISQKNVGQYADKLTDGAKAMLAKYPDSFRIDVYKTHRTAAAPQWVYDNIAKNATRARLNGDLVEGAYGGVPFPIPSSGAEVMWNHILRWRGTAAQWQVTQYQLTSAGNAVLTTVGAADQQMPYYLPDGSPEEFAKRGEYWMVRLVNNGPPIRAGEAIVGREQIDGSKSQSWVYLTGQRRVRKLPNPCCDTPTPATAGVMTFDEIESFTGRLDRFDWKLLGKQEMYIPYNGNRLLQPQKDEAVLSAHHLNPDHVRWELHRMWVVEATLRAGASPGDAQPLLLRRGHLGLRAGRPLGRERPVVAHLVDANLRRPRSAGNRHRRVRDERSAGRVGLCRQPLQRPAGPLRGEAALPGSGVHAGRHGGRRRALTRSSGRAASSPRPRPPK